MVPQTANDHSTPAAHWPLLLQFLLTANGGQWKSVMSLLLSCTTSCSNASQVDGSSDFKLLGRAFAGSLLKLASIDVGDEAVGLH